MVSVTIPNHYQVDNGIVSLTNPNHHQWHHLFAISNHHQRHRLCDTPFQPIINGIVFFDDNAKLTACSTFPRFVRDSRFLQHHSPHALFSGRS